MPRFTPVGDPSRVWSAVGTATGRGREEVELRRLEGAEEEQSAAEEHGAEPWVQQRARASASLPPTRPSTPQSALSSGEDDEDCTQATQVTGRALSTRS